MNTTPKTDECIKMLGVAQLALNPLHYNDNEHFIKDRVIEYQNRIIAMLDYRLMSFSILTMPEDADKEGLRAFLEKHNRTALSDIDNLWYVMKNYPLVTADDLKNEFWGICPNVESIPNVLNVILVKFDEVNCDYDTDINTIKKQYNGLNRLVELGKITEQEADTIYWNIHFISERYNFTIYCIREIYRTFRKMSEPYQREDADTNKPHQMHFTRLFTGTERQHLFNWLIKGGFIPKDTNPDHFNFVFGGDATIDFKPLKWCVSGVLLGYFIDMGFADTDNTYMWKKTKYCFTINGKEININSIKNSISKLKDNGKYLSKPKKSDKIDDIWDNL